MRSGDQTTNHRRKGHEPRLRTSYRSTMGRSTRCPKRRRPSLSEPSAMRGQRAGRPTAATTKREGSSRASGKSSSACRSSAGRPRRRCETGSPKCWPTRNSRLSTGAGSGRTRDRAHHPRNQEEDEGRRDFPGRQLGPHAGDDEA